MTTFFKFQSTMTLKIFWVCPQPKRLDQVYRNNKTTPLRDNFLSLIKEHSQKLNHFFLISEKTNITVRFICTHHNNNVDDSKIKEIKSLCKRRCKYSSKHSFLVHDFNIELLKLRALYNLENSFISSQNFISQDSQ